jgi:hypothetical protein
MKIQTRQWILKLWWKKICQSQILWFLTSVLNSKRKSRVTGKKPGYENPWIIEGFDQEFYVFMNSVSEHAWGHYVVMSTISERKHKRSDIVAYYRNRADLFHFGPKFLGRSKPIWFSPEIDWCRVERFYLIQKNIDRSKTFWIGAKNFLCPSRSFSFGQKIWDEAKQFDLVRKLSHVKRNVSC